MTLVILAAFMLAGCADHPKLGAWCAERCQKAGAAFARVDDYAMCACIYDTEGPCG